MITGAQVRAARALLDWTQQDLAARSNVALRTVRMFEAAEGNAYVKTQSQLQAALENAGIEFLETDEGGRGLMHKKARVS